jgi:hypothetical protein
MINQYSAALLKTIRKVGKSVFPGVCDALR